MNLTFLPKEQLKTAICKMFNSDPEFCGLLQAAIPRHVVQNDAMMHGLARIIDVLFDYRMQVC